MMIEAIVGAGLVTAAGAVLAKREVRRNRIRKQLKVGENGIAESRYVRIGGIEQWIQIRGENVDNPVLFVLHGGPGSPYAVFTPLIRSWEKHYTVVQWDRRGCGRTRQKSGSDAGTFAQLVEDAEEAAEWVKQRLNKDKLTLVAGSMGTIIGVPLAKKRPDLFAAFVCTDMYTDMWANERVGYEKALDRANTQQLNKLQKIGGDPSKWDLKAWQTKMDIAMKTDPVTPNAVAKLLFPLAFASPLYRLRDAVAMLAGFMSVQKQLYAEYSRYNAYDHGMRFDMPFVMLQGEKDILTITELAQEYFDRVEAPSKAIELIPNASHFAAFTQPEATLAALQRALRTQAVA